MISYRRVIFFAYFFLSCFVFSRSVLQLLVVQVNVHLLLSCVQSNEENLHVCIYVFQGPVAGSPADSTDQWLTNDTKLPP